jgi:hypothetical protein
MPDALAHACNPNYLGDWDQEDHALRPAWANSLRDLISKIVAQAVER